LQLLSLTLLRPGLTGVQCSIYAFVKNEVLSHTGLLLS
jgi:hypothetical protein